MVAVLPILDGASEPIGAGPTSLERATTPVLGRLIREGALSRMRTIAPGLRAALEAAARGIELGPDERAWRIDVRTQDGRRAGEQATTEAAQALAKRAPAHTIRRIGGHRLLLTGPPPLPSAAHARNLYSWPAGIAPPRVLDVDVVMIAAPGAAAGCARLLGATVFNPSGATGGADSDLHTKAAALAAIDAETRRVVVHVGAADEAAHARDAAGKLTAIERIDSELIAPIVRAVRRAGGSLAICPDHGCGPATGRHDDRPVPHLRWPCSQGPAGRLTERTVSTLPVVDLEVLVTA